MAERRFHSRRQWHNTRLTLYAGPFLVLGGVLSGVLSGRFQLMAVLLVLFVAAFIAALVRDASSKATYSISGADITLTKGSASLKLPGASIIDASLIDRQAAREYFHTKVLPRFGSKRSARNAFLRYCTVDIGLQSFTFGFGRGVIDRMPDARQHLVLLRLHDQSELLLSPEYNHELVETFLRMQRRIRDSA
jgi:hypothetical protein